MNSIAAKQKMPFTAARQADPENIPWVPIGDGKSFKPLRFFSDNRGFAELLRIEPGTVIPLHRHTGEIHAFNLEGTREICTGEIIEPGQYVYEPAGNVDTWQVTGDVPCIIFVTVAGEVQFLGDDLEVLRSVSGDDLRESYQKYCKDNGIEILDLVD